MGNTNRARTRAVKAEMAATGKKWTAAARDMDASGVDHSRPPAFTWRFATARLDVMVCELASALDILDPLDGDEDDFQLPRVSRLALDKEAKIEMLIAIGDDGVPLEQRTSLPGVLAAYLSAAYQPGPSGYDRARDRLARARDYHRMWTVEQAWALITAAVDGRGPVEVPVRLPVSRYEMAPWWNPPADAHTILDRLPASPERDKVHGAIFGMEHALRAQEDLSEWAAAIREGHDCEPDEGDDDGRCPHDFGPADHEIVEWNALEDDAAGYEPAMTEFCFAARELIVVHVEAAAG